MFVGVLSVAFHIPESGSLKSKRRVVRCLKDKIRAHHNVSVSETGALDKWQRAELGIACVGADKKYINGTLSRIADTLNDFPDAYVIDLKMEIW